jgi:hypothetical protein
MLSGYAEDPDNWIFAFKIAYIGSLKLGGGGNPQTAVYLRLFIYPQIKH